MDIYLRLVNDCFKILNSIPLYRRQSLILLLVFSSVCIATRQHAKFKALRIQARSEAVLVVQEELSSLRVRRWTISVLGLNGHLQ